MSIKFKAIERGQQGVPGGGTKNGMLPMWHKASAI